MRHLNDRRQLSRNSTHRRAMFRNMATSLFMNGRIATTEAKAKELRRYADRLITLGKRYHAVGEPGDNQELAAKRLHIHRQALSYLKDQKAVEIILKELPVRFEGRPGGYTRIFKTGFRRGDAAEMALIEILPREEDASKEAKTKRRRRRTKAKGEESAAAKSGKPAKPAKEAPAAEEPAPESEGEEKK